MQCACERVREKRVGLGVQAAGGELKLRVGKTEALRRLAALAFNLNVKHTQYTTYKAPQKIIHVILKPIQ